MNRHSRVGLVQCIPCMRVSECMHECARVCNLACARDHVCCVRADDPDAAEDAGDAEGAHGADDDDGHVERAQRREGEGHHDEVEPVIIFLHAYMYACRNSICVLLVRRGRRRERKREREGGRKARGNGERMDGGRHGDCQESSL